LEKSVQAKRDCHRITASSKLDDFRKAVVHHQTTSETGIEDKLH